MNVFNGVTSPRVSSKRCVLPVELQFNLTYGLKPQVSGTEIVTVYRRTFEWLIATLIGKWCIRELLEQPKRSLDVLAAAFVLLQNIAKMQKVQTEPKHKELNPVKSYLH